MGKRKDRNHVLERYSRGRLQMTLAEWVVNSLDEDYAFDFEVRPTEGIEVDSRDKHGDAVLPSPFYVQLKASERFDDPDSVWHDFETDFLIEDCLQASVPVVLVICDRRSEELYWCVLQSHCWNVLDEENEGWREQTQVRVRIERKSLADSLHLAKFRSAVQNAAHRISTRQRVASARRDSLDHPFRMDVASASQVRAYKERLVTDAVDLANAGRREGARNRLLEVCKMTEDDEPTLEAFRHLLELRNTDDPSIALIKIRFAREGARLTELLDQEELWDEFESHYMEAREYLQETLVGARYRDQQGLPILVLDIEPIGPLKGGTARSIATVQHGSELTDLSASALANAEPYEFVESGESTDPRDDACAEREHQFDREALQEYPLVAKCSECGLSYETIQQWLKHDVPSVCDECGSIVYDVEVFRDEETHRDILRCADCRL